MSSTVDKKLILNKIRDGYKFKNDTAFAKFLDIRPQTLSNWMTRNSFDIDIVYTKCVNVRAEFLITGIEPVFKTSDNVDEIDNNKPVSVFKLKTDNVQEKQSVPLYDIQASASVLALFKDQDDQKPIDHISIPNLPKCDGAIYVSGDSMYPLLKSGDIIMYKKIENALDAIFWGEMYLVSIINDYGDEFVMIKWLHRSDIGQEYVKLVSENRHHQPTEFHIRNIKGLALIKASVRINSMH